MLVPLVAIIGAASSPNGIAPTWSAPTWRAPATDEVMQDVLDLPSPLDEALIENLERAAMTAETERKYAL